MNQSTKAFLLYAFAVLALLLVAAIFGQKSFVVLKVKEDSMRPNFCPGDLLFVRVINNAGGIDYSKYIGVPMVFGTKENTMAIKRVYATPSQSVSYTFDEVTSSNFASANISVCTSGKVSLRAPDRLTVGKRELFVVGDNLSKSTDSRAFGSVPMTSVVGPVVYSFPMRFKDCTCSDWR